MRGRLRPGPVAALILGILLVGSGLAGTAGAFEWDLPGERKLSVHGFYESRLMFVGSELPLNGATWSSWRHVLVTEIEFNAFPDGFGPFDSMFMFTRFLVSYECIYTRACGTAGNADSYGDDSRSARRQPLSLAEDAKNNPTYFAGLLEQTYRPGSLVAPEEELNPGRRYRDCNNPPGVFSNPFPLAVFCNLNNRSPLDNPNNQTGIKTWEVRAGTFHPFTRPSLLAAARPTIGEGEYTRLRDLLIDGQVLSSAQTSLRQALRAEAAETDDPTQKAALQAQADAILGTPDGDTATFDANIPTLLATRPDQNRFAILAQNMAPELLTAQWGSSRLRNMVWPFLATINTPIRPEGYFSGGGALDTVGHYDQALGENLLFAIGGLPVPPPGGTTVFTAENAQKSANPFFVGPDGIRHTADDLPFVATNPINGRLPPSEQYVLAAPLAGTLRTDENRFDQFDGSATSTTNPKRDRYSLTAQFTVSRLDATGAPMVVELYGVFSEGYLIDSGCVGAGGVFNRVTRQCMQGTENLSEVARGLGCKAIKTSQPGRQVGVNADGHCIDLNASDPRTAQSQAGKIQFEVLGLLGDLNARPLQAVAEPLDMTDFRAVAAGGVNNTLPARPRASDNGLLFQSPGARQEHEQYHNLVSNLDLKYSVDSLQWNHGANQREHEFAEGYLEFEMADSQIYTRVGKLIVVWGKTELFRNQDRNNPVDIGNGIFAPLEEQRIGQWGVDMTFSPEMFMRIGPVEDLRLELIGLFNPFEPTDLGKCGEGSAVDVICLKSFGAIANGMAGIGLIGEHRPWNDYSGLARFDFGARLEGRFDRFTFAISDFWGWDDGFYLDLVHQYERTSDLATGAPLSTGSRKAPAGCTVRRNSDGVALGPDGTAGTGDEAFPSDGNCLLWNPPATAGAQQTLRSSDAVAALQNVNQTLFHSLCAYTFDSDEGYCAFDRLNEPRDFGLVSNIISGYGFVGGAVLDGVETIQTVNADGSTGVVPRGSPAFLAQTFQPIEPLARNDRLLQDLGVSLRPGQSALLGCGEAYASACSEAQSTAWSAIPAIETGLSRIDANGVSTGRSGLGGVDLMNADASVVTQEFVGLKALSPGALVGTKLNDSQILYYQAGVNFSRTGQQNIDVDTYFNEQGRRVAAPPPQVGTIEEGDYLELTPQEVIDMGEIGRATYQIGREVPNPDYDPDDSEGEEPETIRTLNRETDSWIEPMPWTVNQEMLEKYGAIVFNSDPNSPLDLTSEKNQWNLIDPDAPIRFSNINGEYCARWMNNEDVDVATPFNLGCTGLETVSANFERLLISLEIIGADRLFDPPESLQELSFLSQSNTARQAAGDPIAGDDGIFARNQFVFSDEEMDFDVIKTTLWDDGAPAPADYAIVRVPVPVGSDPRGLHLDFLLGFDPEADARLPVTDSEKTCLNRAWCYLEVNNVLTEQNVPVGAGDAKNDDESLILAMPISFEVDVVRFEEGDETTDPIDTGIDRRVNLAKLQYLQQEEGVTTLRRLLASETVEIETDAGTVFVKMSPSQAIQLFGEVGILSSRGRDMDTQDLSPDLDRNRDGIWDGQDDYLPGPITDDNILCGSGVPGDKLQDGVQYSPYRADEARDSAKFAAAFPNGLPPRSPVFCRGVAGILGATNQTLPIRKAGGDGRYGRRDFLWQNGRQIALNYQKRNVFGFGLDFAEDVTKTSWGVEFSWMANKLIPNTFEYDGLSETDEMVLSISVDRPTFFNFLNPNRSFFMNLQMFLRYLPSYRGGRSDVDGNYGVAGGPLTGNVAFTFFTGYFQDRLAPRVTLLYLPWESQGAIITGLSYRWNDAFSTSLGFTQFFGHVYKQQGSFFPIAQYGSVADYNSPVFRGVAPVLYRDLAEVRIRYTW